MGKRRDITFVILASVSIALFVAGFIVPPTGKIDGSVLSAVGLLIALFAVKQIPEAIIQGKEIRLKHGNTSLAIGDGKDLDRQERKEVGNE